MQKIDFDMALKWASKNGHLDICKLLVVCESDNDYYELKKWEEER